MNNNAEILRRHKAEVEARIQSLQKEITETAVQHFKDNFPVEGFVDTTVEYWQKRKPSRNDDGHPVLNKTGALKESIEVKSYNGENAIIGSDIVYANIHNNGGAGRAWGKHSFIMPKRQFIGDSEALNQKLIKLIDESMNTLFN